MTAKTSQGARGLQSFYDVAVDAIHAEDLQLRLLFKGRPWYGEYAPSIATLFETGTVYAILKGLLSSSFAQSWIVHWEGRHLEGLQHVDLVYFSPRKPAVRAGIEVKWWTKGGSGIVRDCRKLARDDSFSQRAVLALHVWRPDGARRAKTLRQLFERAVGDGRFRGVDAWLEASHYTECAAKTWFGEPARLGVALIQVS